MAINDVAVVSTCPATYMSGKIRLEMRAFATLDVESSDLTIGDYLKMDDGAVVTQTGLGGTVNVGNYLTLTDSTYKLMVGDVLLKVGGDLTLNANSKLIIEGDGSTFTANNLVLQDATSTIDITLGPNVPVAPGLVHGTFTPNGGKLTVDASAYSHAGVTRIPLIKFQSMVGTFSPSNIVISGLSGAIDITANSLDFVVGATPTPPYIIDYTMDVLLNANGDDPVTVGLQDVIIDPNKAGLVIDGSNYTAGAGTIPILDWRDATSRYGRFEPKNIVLREFDSGLWFELQYNDDQIQLVIKRLSDYSEYWGDRFTNNDVYEEEPDSSRFPDYSWEKVPRWMNIRKNRAFQPGELENIASNNAIVKIASLAGYLTNEEGSVDTATELKKLNKDLVTLCYWNSMVYWGWYQAFNPALPLAWLRWIINDQGQNVLLSQGSAKDPRYFYDQSKAAMRQWWTNSAISMVSEENFDGIFIDKAADPRNQMTAGHRQMITELAEKIPTPKLYIGNALRQMAVDGSRDRLKYMDGSYMENWAWGVQCNPRRHSEEYCMKENWNKHTSDWQPVFEMATVSIQLAREALSKKKMILLTAGPWGCPHPCDMNEQEMKEKITMPMAIFLMMVEPGAYLNYQQSSLFSNTHQSTGKRILVAFQNLQMLLGNQWARLSKSATRSQDPSSILRLQLICLMKLPHWIGIKFNRSFFLLSFDER